MSDITLAFRQPNTAKAKKLTCFGPSEEECWKDCNFAGDHLDFHFQTDGDGADEPEHRWGLWAAVMPKSSSPVTKQVVDILMKAWVDATARAEGIEDDPQVEKDGW